MCNLFLIPARGGSKGVKRKNIRELDLRPLITYSIEFGLLVRQKDTDVVCVSSDDEEILDIASMYDGVVALKRPEEFATDVAKTIDVAQHAIMHFNRNNQFFQNLTLLQPTCPFRRKHTYLKALKIMKEHNHSSLISVKKEEYIYPSVSYKPKGDILHPLTAKHNAGGRRQDEVPYFVRTGNLYLVNVDFLMESNSFISARPAYVENDIFEAINIDTEEDLKLAQIIAKDWRRNAYWNS